MNISEQHAATVSRLDDLLRKVIAAEQDLIDFAAVKSIDSSESGFVSHDDMETIIQWSLEIVTTATILLVSLRDDIGIKVVDGEVCLETRGAK